MEILDKEELVRKSEYEQFNKTLMEKLNALCDENTVIVVGGKSRRVVETIIRIFIQHELLNNVVQAAWANRVRLDQNTNQGLYNPELGMSQEVIVEHIENKVAGGKKVLFIDDTLDTGHKAFHLIENLNSNDIEAHFLALSGRLDLSAEAEEMRPQSWSNYEAQVHSITSKTAPAREINRTASVLSLALEERIERSSQKAQSISRIATDDLNKVTNSIMATLPITS